MSSKERSHFADFQLDGRWWLPGTPERRVYGTLRYSQASGITIDLMDRLKELDWKPGPVSMDSLVNEFPIVLGQSDTLESCTVLRSFETSGSLFPMDGGRSRLRAHRLYIGSHFTTEEEIQFEQQRLEFAYLEDWVGMSPFRVERYLEPLRTLIEMQHEPKEIARARIDNKKTDLWIQLVPTLSYGFQGEFTGGRCASVFVKPDEEQPYSWYEGVARSIGNLFTLCIGQPVLPRRIIGERSFPKGSKVERIEIYIPLLEIRQKGDVSYATMPVPLPMIQDRVASVITSWFAAEEKIEPVLGLLLGTYYNPHMYVETEFLTLMQALEIFHRRLIGGSYLSGEQWLPHFNALVLAIPPELEEGHKASLKKRLEYGREYSLRKRLENLINSLSEDARKYVTEGYENFVGQCADTRNALVHEGGGGILAQGLQALWTANRRLRVLLNILIWTELGLKDRFSNDFFRRVE
jgi:hypothetical protein